jgi:hypothetical protein
VTRLEYEKIAQNAAVPIFCQNKYTFFSEKRSSPKIWAVSVIFEKLPKENNISFGENSPNPVTLKRSLHFQSRCFRPSFTPTLA